MKRLLVLLLICSPVFAADRDADKAAIRAHIEKIFQAYIDRDCATIRSTHSANWIGFTTQARSIVHGIDGYMSFAPCTAAAAKNPNRMTAYQILSIDYEFYGDVALVPYVAETTGTTWSASKLRSLDVYHKENGGWIQVGSNIYLHPDTVDAMQKH
ncbi:MAG TPA: nuclear transport factor 2 family protein [Thermoanaerobaculia bacterium]|nr:nuclear transport factor 2 family protein [Thermoanaerobaculia bacterium]